MTTGEIQGHLQDVYGTLISRDTISRITDAVIEELTSGRTRRWTSVAPLAPSIVYQFGNTRLPPERQLAAAL